MPSEYSKVKRYMFLKDFDIFLACTTDSRLFRRYFVPV